MTTRAGRRIGRIAALGVVALVLAGAVATPVEARTRQQAIRTANGDARMCAEIGGSQVRTDTGSSIQMICMLDGERFWDWETSYDD
jgi:ferric-dicitrate binding protein FerR (iron transport regulator)